MAKLSNMAVATEIVAGAKLFGYDPSETNPINRTKSFLISDIVNSSNYPIQSGEVGVVDLTYPVGHVRRYGAVGDGVTEDSAAFSLACAASKDVTVDDGTFLVTRANTSDNVTQSGTRIHGNGRSSKIVSGFNYGALAGVNKSGNEYYNAFQATGLAGLTIENLSFEKCAILAAFSCTDVVVRNCYIDGYHDTVFQDKGIYVYKCTRVTVYANTFKNVNFSTYLAGDAGTRSSQCLVFGNHYEHDQTSTVNLFPVGVYVYFGDSVTVTSNTFKNIYSSLDNGTTGTGMGYGVYEGDGSCDKVIITSNTFEYVGNGNKNAIAITINQALNAVIAHNAANGAAAGRLTVGILLDVKVTGSTRTVVGNTLTSATVLTSHFGIYLNGTSKTNQGTFNLTANTVTGFGNGIRQDFLGQCDVLVADNLCKSQTAAGMQFSGESDNPARFLKITGNSVTKSQTNALLFNQYVVSPTVENNKLLDGNLSSGAGDVYAAISFVSNSFGCKIANNLIGNTPGGGGLFQYGISNAASTTARIFKDITRQNTFIGINVVNQQYVRFPAAAPTVSIFDAEYGDFVENVTLNASGNPGWHCVIAKFLTMTVDANNASASITVSSTAGMLAGDIVLFCKDNNPYDTDYSDVTKWHADTVLAVVDGTHFTLTTGIPAGDGTYTAANAVLKTARYKAAAAIAA